MELHPGPTPPGSVFHQITGVQRHRVGPDSTTARVMSRRVGNGAAHSGHICAIGCVVPASLANRDTTWIHDQSYTFDVTQIIADLAVASLSDEPRHPKMV